MQDEADTRRGPTRRDTLRYGGAALGSGVLAGCTGDPTRDGVEADGNGGGNGGSGGNGDNGDDSYTVSMAPVGEVEFDSVPENVMVYSLLYADMAVAFGQADAVNSLGFDAETGGNTLDAYYERLDGVSFDRDGLTQLNTGSGQIDVDRELFYELDSDLHLVDPCLVRSFDGWGADDIAKIRDAIAPWFGNEYSREHGEPPEGCREEYEYYTLWELTERVSQVFRAEERFEALQAVYDAMLETIRADLPPEDERPTVGSVIFMEETFYPSRIDGPGFATAHVRPLEPVDAFAGEEITSETTYDYERMLEFDPDVILHEFGIASYYDVADIRETIAEHPVGGELSAVQSDRVYPGGDPVQGPIMNLFQFEMTAKQLYPEQFGEWPSYTHGEAYPEIPSDEQLFDRDAVAAIVNGEV